MDIERSEKGYVLVDLVDSRHIIAGVGIGVIGILGLSACPVLLADEVHELLLLEVFGQAVEGFLVDACVPQEGLRKAEDAQDLSVSGRGLVGGRIDCGLSRNFNLLYELLLGDVGLDHKRN